MTDTSIISQIKPSSTQRLTRNVNTLNEELSQVKEGYDLSLNDNNN